MRRRAVVLLMASLTAVSACGGASSDGTSTSSMGVGQWTEGPLREDGDAFTSAIDAATEGFQGTSFVQTDCRRLADVASRASQKPRPDDQTLASIWTSVLKHGSDAASACSRDDGEAFIAALSAFAGEIGRAKERVAAL